MREKLKVHGGDIPGKVIEVKLEYPKPKAVTMSDIKCPVCKGELLIFKSSTQDAIVCADCGFDGNTKLWQELIRTRKALDVAVDALKKIKMSHNTESFYRATAELALDEITALEKKDVK